MSIYPVRCKTWWVVSRSCKLDDRRKVRLERNIIKSAMKAGLKCSRCGKNVEWDKAYVSHAFLYGFNDVYCGR